MSAQRSRLRQKKILSKLEKENEVLKTQNSDLQKKIDKLLEEKNKMNLDLDQVRTARHSVSTDNESDHKQEPDMTLQRTEPLLKNSVFKSSFLFMFGILMILFVL